MAPETPINNGSGQDKQGQLSREIGLYAVFTALIVVLSILSIPLPPPLAYFSFVPIVIFFLGITLKPKRAFSICVIGAILGELLADIIFGYASYLWLYLPGAFVARGLEGLILSLLEKFLVRGKNLSRQRQYTIETIIVTIGAIWEFFGYVNIGAIGNYALMGWPYIDTLMSYLWVLIDFTLIPAGIAVIIGVRKYYNQDYFDHILFNDSEDPNATK